MKIKQYDGGHSGRKMGKFTGVIINLVITAIFGFIYFYVTLPAINIQAKEFYSFVILLCIVYIVCSFITSGVKIDKSTDNYFTVLKKYSKVPIILIGVVIAVSILGSLTSAEFFRARAYRDLLPIKQGDFADEVKELSFDKIPMLDKDSAERLGDRKMGELADMVSQFEVANEYAQINFNNRPVRVTPLEYGDAIKWLTNRKNGIPAYLIIDMATQAVDVVRLSEGMKYSNSEHFGRNLSRYIRFKYPGYMFSTPTFEIDDNKNPYWVCPKIVKKVGLFGGTDVDGAVLVNAVTGETEYCKEVPTWIDRVYPADLIVQQYDYYGSYRNGFINSIFGQKDVTKTTAGCNYIVLNDDVYVYTGITSVGGDQSNIGFILSNQRTKETTYYPVAGAAEYSAMSSAEGVVQHLGYKSTFPLLLNVSSQPTYFMSLKDNAKLVKMYAMVNVEQYQIVATGTTLTECEANYAKLMMQNNITVDVPPETFVSGKISDIKTAVKNGNTYYYIKIEGNNNYYSISAATSENVVILNVGDTVKITADNKSEAVIKPAHDIEIIVQ